MWDETILTRGITHLVEHLSLFPLRDVEHEYGGTVTGNFMVVWATGTAEELRALNVPVVDHFLNRRAPKKRTEVDQRLASLFKENS